MNEKSKRAVCPWCWYARDREDICGVYCTGGFENEDGTCDRFVDCFEMEELNGWKVVAL